MCLIKLTVATCREPVVPSNSYIASGGNPVGGRYRSGDTITYQCNPGYQPAFTGTNMTSQCLPSGSWSLCQVYCIRIISCSAPPPSPANSYVVASPSPDSSNRYSMGSKFRYGCSDGYTMSGVDTITCSEAGEWSHHEFCCTKITCPQPQLPRNSRMIGGGGQLGQMYSPGDFIDLACIDGYSASAFSQTRMECLQSGQWSVSSLVCSRIITCPAPPQPPQNGFLSSPEQMQSSHRVGTIAYYQCRNGYTLQGSGTVTCQSDGSWSNLDFCCVVSSCGNPAEPYNSHINLSQSARPGASGYRIGDRVMFECDDGFLPIVGTSGLAQCLEGGDWSRATLVCTQVKTCPAAPQLPSNAYIRRQSQATQDGRFSLGSFLELACLDGFKPSGQTTITCNNDGTWSPMAFCCERGRFKVEIS